MYAEERQQAMAQAIGQDGRLSVTQLAETFDVTTETVRRDLSSLERIGLVRRVHGGAVPASSLSAIESGLGERDQANTGAKDAIAAAAVLQLPPAGSVVILDAGSTTGRLAAVLPREHRLTVVTHAVPIAARLAGLPHIELHLLPGRVRPTTHAAVGSDTVAALHDLRADLAFLATNGLSADFGLTTPDRDEAATKRAIEAVVFDWGGTLTRWHDIDFHAESLALAAAVRHSDDPTAVELVETHASRLLAAGSVVWGRSRDHQQSATIADLFAEAGLEHDPELLSAYYDFWEPHTETDPDVRPMWEELKTMGLRVGVLSNTIWPREWHEGFFRRDGVLDLIDGDVYTSEIPWTKPAPEAFRASAVAVGVTDPARCVYVGDRLFDDIWGARHAGMRAILVPHSTIPAEQRGHTEGEPDAVAHSVADISSIVRGWR